jgi:hypothetical protein
MTPACALTCATGGAVTAAAQTMKLKAWLTSQGVALPRRPKALKGGLKYEDCLEAEDIQKLLAGNPPNAEARAGSGALFQSQNLKKPELLGRVQEEGVIQEHRRTDVDHRW